MMFAPIALVLRGMGVRFMPVGFHGRLGHLVCESYAADWFRRTESRRIHRIVMLVPGGGCANQAVLEAIGWRFLVVRNRWVARFLVPLTFSPLVALKTGEFVGSTTGAAGIFRAGASDPFAQSFLCSPRDSGSEREELLEGLGVRDYSWYVCIHVREDGYSPRDDAVHSYRNASWSHLDATLNFLAEQGAAVIRIGDPSMSTIPPQSGVVDYAHHHLKSPRNDLLLASGARFMVGNSSGANVLFGFQGVPVLGLNMAPLGASLMLFPQDLSIPKLYRDIESGKFLSFGEVFSSNLSRARRAEEFKRAGVEVIENSEEDALAAVIDMHNLVSGNHVWTEDSQELENAFRGQMPPDSYSALSAARIAPSFLVKHRALILGCG